MAISLNVDFYNFTGAIVFALNFTVIFSARPYDVRACEFLNARIYCNAAQQVLYNNSRTRNCSPNVGCPLTVSSICVICVFSRIEKTYFIQNHFGPRTGDTTQWAESQLNHRPRDPLRTSVKEKEKS